MKTSNPKIQKYSGQYKEQVLSVWERSVLATHGFLSQEDFQSIKEIVRKIDFNQFDVFCLIQDDKVLGFLGVAGQKTEMLFLDPDYFGQGLGKVLMNYAINELSVDKVDVNEQNIKAVNFYQHLGFKTYERTDKDDLGKDYPLLRMKLDRQE
ncbi:MAG TPA: GNAT family N-acetyltransferase [Chitinophagaceae bacterium]